MIRFWRFLLALSCSALLAACVTPARIISTQADVQTNTQEFSRVGRFALTVTEVGADPHATQGGFSWLDEGGQFTLDLTNPLGSTQARVQGKPGLAVLTRANGEQLSAPDPDALAEEALGSRVPVASLRDWFQGRLAQQLAATSVQRDDKGRPTAFEQGGWRAVASRYDDLGPQVLVLERQEPGRRIVLRLVVTNPS